MKTMKFISVLLFVSISLGVPQAAHATGSVCHVAADAGGSNDGSSWVNAYTDLQSALGICAEIWVKAGVYKPGTSRTDSFNIPHGARVYGGFAGTETMLSQRNPATHLTILSGDIDNNDTNYDGNNIDEAAADVHSNNSYHIVTMDGTVMSVTSSTVLDGFTITGGDAYGTAPADSGGGFYCDGHDSGSQCSPSLSNLTFSGNRADLFGGAAFNDGSSGGTSSPMLKDVTFSGNEAGSSGGALANGAANGGTSSPSLTNVTFNGNSAYVGGAVLDYGYSGGTSSPTLTDVAFSGNSAAFGGAIQNGGYTGGVSTPSFSGVSFSGNSAFYDGGAMDNQGGNGLSSPALMNVSFVNNHAGRNGGAMYNYGKNGDSSPGLTNVTFNGNSADTYGGAIYNDGNGGSSSPALTNVTFTSNTAIRGGAVFSDGSIVGSSNAAFTNVTFSSNSASGYGGALFNTAVLGASHPSLTNVILWGDGSPTGPEIYNSTASTNISYSVIQGAYNPRTGSWDSSLGFDGGGNRGVDPLLGPLADNGGFTQTMALNVGSAALDMGNNSTCSATDQRGVTRPQGQACDIGSFEVLVYTLFLPLILR